VRTRGTPAYTPGVRRRSPRRVIVALSAAVGLSLTACGVDIDVATSRADTLTTEPTSPDTTDDTDTSSPETSEPTDPTDPTEPTDPADPTTTVEQVIDDSNDIADVVNVGDDKESRPYDEFVAASLSDVQAFWRATYPEVYGQPFEELSGGIYAAYPNRDDVPGCGEPRTSYEEVSQFVAFYCTLGDFMVYDDGDRSLLGALAENFGPSIMGVVLAHEFGHAIQFRTGDLEQGYPTISTEQQADCFAGAWVRWASSGRSSTIQLTDSDIRGGLIAMVTVRDPIGTAQTVEGAHGSAFDRVGAFQVGFNEGAQRCSEILDTPLPLVSNEFIDPDDVLNEGDLPYGFEPGDIIPLVVTALNLYWTFAAREEGIEFPALTLVPVSATDEVNCDDLTGPVPQSAVVCPSTNEVYFDEPFAEELYNDPIEGRADFAVGYLVATGWAEEAQILLGSPLTGEPRALTNDCLVGAWTADMLPGRALRPEEGESRGLVSPGDLDEAVLAAITIGDPGFGDDRIGSAFEKIDSFREGVLGGIPACTERINE
jgi:predicted metalloprotease